MAEPTLLILHVDDDEANRYAVTRSLKVAGFNVIEAVDGKDALAKVVQQPDLVILDVRLPDMDGFEVCQKIKTNPSTTHIPILHLSANFVSGKDKAQGLDGGADAYLVRPVEPVELIATVNALLRVKRSEDALRKSEAHNRQLVEELQKAMAEREKSLASAQAARAEAERASHMKDEFLATLSHELRTPLNAILGWSAILRDPRSDATEIREGLEVIDRNARAQTQMIEDLLDMSRIISGKIRLDVQPIDLLAVISAAIETVKPMADAKGIHISTMLDPAASAITGDPNRLQQVCWNLLTNAVKFTGKNGRIQVRLSRVDSSLQLSVSDTGQGITPDFLPHVFDRFRQADGSMTRRHGGLGLGLAIVKQLVELHGGTVHAASEGRDKGATLTVVLPLLSINTLSDGDYGRHPQAPPTLSAKAVPCIKLSGVKALIVDDEPDARELVRRLLRDCNAFVSTAASAAEAMMMLEQERPDILISDIGMPEEDGYVLIERIRALPADRGGAIPALALTAYARSEDRTRSMLAGFQMHISKPVEPAELIAIVASLVKGRGS